MPDFHIVVIEFVGFEFDVVVEFVVVVVKFVPENFV